jgi:hypothetical protein
VEFVDTLPRTPTARIARRLLPRERTAAEYDADKRHVDDSLSRVALKGKI